MLILYVMTTSNEAEQESSRIRTREEKYKKSFLSARK